MSWTIEATPKVETTWTEVDIRELRVHGAWMESDGCIRITFFECLTKHATDAAREYLEKLAAAGDELCQRALVESARRRLTT